MLFHNWGKSMQSCHWEPHETRERMWLYEPNRLRAAILLKSAKNPKPQKPKPKQKTKKQTNNKKKKKKERKKKEKEKHTPS